MENVLSVTALKYAESTLAERCIFPGGASDKRLPISFTIYLIKTDKHMILVDAGCDTMPGFEMKNFCGPKEIEEYVIPAEEICSVCGNWIIRSAACEAVKATYFHYYGPATGTLP